MVNQGFRRSGLFIYRPYCDNCQRCIPIRIPVNEFSPSRTQRRIWNKHQHLQTRIIAPQFVSEHYQLYVDYQTRRHQGSGMAIDSEEQYVQFLLESHVQTTLVEFRAPSRTTHQGLVADPASLKMVSVIDKLANGWSAVYTFYRPEAQCSYGVFNILWQIQQAQLHGLQYLYLGYWIAKSAKMAYKSSFLPAELLIEGDWHRYDPSEKMITQYL